MEGSLTVGGLAEGGLGCQGLIDEVCGQAVPGALGGGHNIRKQNEEGKRNPESTEQTTTECDVDNTVEHLTQLRVNDGNITGLDYSVCKEKVVF